ncbi:hypothetical protein [Methylomonas sp. UP202]|uniref:hypothetical protein n=1 Tax=Methylomonas sp. UP202 TaxID=3040943 RepID=UPI00247ADE10|nr:hypothetical protein [Methylomonas sp. UP202]WGS84171.1 hypothetical protein QC632_14035 [Methylomonas sp. UP202]
MFRPKDFIETAEQLIFAVVADGLEAGRILCFLRYAMLDGAWRKVDSDTANAHLAAHYPQYLHYSARLDARLHAVPETAVTRHYHPRHSLRGLLEVEPADPVVADLQSLCALFRRHGLDLDQFGVTGSLQVGMQKHSSDIDLVCYDREIFHRARNVVQCLIAEDYCQVLDDADWLEAYRRRACDFALDEYIWHELRKYNKAMINGRKFDLTLLAPMLESETREYRKLGAIELQARISDDFHAFDYPAVFSIDHPQADSIVCYTATYCGQAQTGEVVAVAGLLEVDDTGRRRVVVGSNREALGEYIQVLR